MPEERLGPYRLVGLLARGGMAEIWQAERDDGASAAVKRLPLHTDVTPTATRRFLDEGKLTVQLAHPNIVRVFEVGIEREQAYIAMERLDGLPLARLLERPRPVGFVVGVAVQLLEGLAHAHAPPFSTVHRDLKPSNLFLTRAGCLKIIDFGIASSAVLDSTRTATGTFRGSVSYASPEQVRGGPIDARSDLYSAGVVLRELLTGRRMYDQTNEAELLGQLLFTPVPPLLGVRGETPPALAAALDSVLAKEPERRPASARSWAEALVVALRPEAPWPPERLAAELAPVLSVSSGTRTLSVRVTAPAAAPAPAATPSPTRRRRRSVWALALAVMICVGVAARTLWPVAPAPVAPAPVVTAAPTPAPAAAPAPAPAPVATPEPAVKPRPRAKAPAATGLITVEVRPGWAEISLNGEAVGPSPIYRRRVLVGRMTVEGVRTDGSRQKRTVEVQAQRENIVVLQW